MSCTDLSSETAATLDSPKTRRSAGLAIVAALVAIKVVVHLLLIQRYGYHGDELYFAECGRKLAFGYVDHPPLIPWIAWAAGAWGHSLLALRLPAIAAGAGSMVLAALLVREWGGGQVAQLLTGLCMLLAPAYLRMGAMLDIPVFEVLIWTAASYLVARIVKRAEPKLWLLVGVVAGIGLLTKHSMLLWGFGLAVGLLLTPARRQLASGWLWAGAAIALALFAPNLWWQHKHGWATFEFLATMRKTVYAGISRPLFLAGQLLYMQPLALPIWAAGLVSLLRHPDRKRRLFGWMFLTSLATLLVTRGKPYYLAPAYPVLFVAGGIWLERFFAQRSPWQRRAYVGMLSASGVVTAIVALPILPIEQLDRSLETVFRQTLPPAALTSHLHGMHGWPQHAAAVARVYRAMPAADQQRATVLAGTYAQASAVNFFGAEHGLPRAVSGHMSYHLWGPDPDRGEVAIAYGLPRSWLERHFAEVREADRLIAPGARRHDTDLPVFECRHPTTNIERMWPELRRYGHFAPSHSIGLRPPPGPALSLWSPGATH